MSRQDEIAEKAVRKSTLKSLQKKKRSRLKQLKIDYENAVQQVQIQYAEDPERLKAKYAAEEYAKRICNTKNNCCKEIRIVLTNATDFEWFSELPKVIPCKK